MKQFLVIFDRDRGSVRTKVFVDRREALRARFAAEREHAGDANVEVVVLGANSMADLRRTHGRYFKSASDLAQAVAGSLHP